MREMSKSLHDQKFRFFKDKIQHIVRHLEAQMLGKDSPYEKKIEGQLSLFGAKE